jgi:hypothetical protein
MSETLTETFARFAEDAEFHHWNEGRALGCIFVQVSQGESIWRFTLQEWWKVVIKAIYNDGIYDLPSPTTRLSLYKKIKKVTTAVGSGGSVRRVNLDRWTLVNWIDELHAI